MDSICKPSKDLKKDNLFQADVPLLIFFALLDIIIIK